MIIGFIDKHMENSSDWIDFDLIQRELILKCDIFLGMWNDKSLKVFV